jgi:hypothetical protein
LISVNVLIMTLVTILFPPKTINLPPDTYSHISTTFLLFGDKYL